MKVKSTYICDTCGKESGNRGEIEFCEAQHLGLTIDENLAYNFLLANVRHFSAIVARTCNDKTQKDWDEAIDKLLVFEKEHNIKNKPI